MLWSCTTKSSQVTSLSAQSSQDSDLEIWRLNSYLNSPSQSSTSPSWSKEWTTRTLSLSRSKKVKGPASKSIICMPISSHVTRTTSSKVKTWSTKSCRSLTKSKLILFQASYLCYVGIWTKWSIRMRLIAVWSRKLNSMTKLWNSLQQKSNEYMNIS